MKRTLDTTKRAVGTSKPDASTRVIDTDALATVNGGTANGRKTVRTHTISELIDVLSGRGSSRPGSSTGS